MSKQGRDAPRRGLKRSLQAAAGLAGATAMFVGMASPAMAGTSVTLKPGGGASFGRFEADGDKIRACDYDADGWGVWVQISWFDGGAKRETSTSGHASPYCTDWYTGNIDEGVEISVTACLIKNGEKTSCRYGTGYA